MKYRSRSEVADLKALVAQHWRAGKTQEQIGAVLGVTRAYAGVMVHGLRAEGVDLPRRKRGRRPAPKAAIVPKRRRSRPRSPDHGDILDAWSDGMQAKDIALLTRRSLGSVKELVRRARLRGDARAIRHERWPADLRRAA